MCKSNKRGHRRCVACGTMYPKHKMMKVVRLIEKEGDKVVNTKFAMDHSQKANGRGAYFCKDSSCIEKGIKSRGLERSYKSSVPSYIYQEVEEEMKQFEQ